jgi:RNA polymerase sigma-70 factor, ECF subfamily
MRLSDDESDAGLMQQAARGDREAFAAIYRRHSATVYRFARLMTGCNAAAEDVVQESFLALLREAGRYDPARASLATYLYGVARNQTRRRLHRDRRFVGLSDEYDSPAATSVADELTREDELARLRRAILSLPSRYREALVLCELQDVSYADAAAAMGCAVGTVRSRLHRARALLADKMQRSSQRDTNGATAMRCAI